MRRIYRFVERKLLLLTVALYLLLPLSFWFPLVLPCVALAALVMLAMIWGGAQKGW